MSSNFMKIGLPKLGCRVACGEERQTWVLQRGAGTEEIYTGGSLVAMVTTRMQRSTFVHFYNFSIIYTEVS